MFHPPFERINSMHELHELEQRLTTLILKTKHPWSKWVLLTADDEKQPELKKQILNHENISHLKKHLFSLKSGLNSPNKNPADFRQSNSFFWILRFFADLKISASEIKIQDFLHRLQLNQVESGQFLLQYNEKKHQSVELVCMTAHLLDCFINLGYQHSNTISTGISFLLATQRRDGSWHCEQNYLDGEKHGNLPGCPAATIFAIRALSHFLPDTKDSVTRAMQFFHIWAEKNQLQCPWLGREKINFAKLRYPPSFVGLDILNVFDSLSLVPNFVKSQLFGEMLENILSKTTNSGLLISDKRLPFWRNFDFGHNKNESTWITALFVRALRRFLHFNE